MQQQQSDVHLCSSPAPRASTPLAKTVRSARYVVCGGGGIYGFSFAGALVGLEAAMGEGEWASFLSRLEGGVGTSAGALVVLLLCVGMHGPRLRSLLTDRLPWSKIVFCISPQSLIEKLGMMETRAALGGIVDACLEGAGLSVRTTLSDVHRMTRKHFVCCVTDLARSELMQIDHLSHPDLPVREAVVASMCVPIMFEPCEIDGAVCVDGGLTANFPIHVFPIEASLILRIAPDEETGERRLSSRENVLSGWKGYLKAVVKCSIVQNDRRLVAALSPAERERILSVPLNQACADALDVGSLNQGVARLLLTAGFLEAAEGARPGITEAAGRMALLAFCVHNTTPDTQ